MRNSLFQAVKQRGNVIIPETEEEIRGYDFEALYAFWGADIFYEEASHLDALETPILLYNGEKDEWALPKNYRSKQDVSKIRSGYISKRRT